MTQTIQHFLEKKNHALGTLFAKLKQLNAWNQYLQEYLCDEPLFAKHCHIVNLSHNSLFVLTDSPHWQTKLRFLIPTLLPKLRTCPGLEKIQAIICKVEPLYKPHRTRLSRKRQAKIHPETGAIMRGIAEKINDPKLRKILEKISERHD
jgi:hypothetical protein